MPGDEELDHVEIRRAATPSISTTRRSRSRGRAAGRRGCTAALRPASGHGLTNVSLLIGRSAILSKRFERIKVPRVGMLRQACARAGTNGSGRQIPETSKSTPPAMSTERSASETTRSPTSLRGTPAMSAVSIMTLRLPMRNTGFRRVAAGPNSAAGTSGATRQVDGCASVAGQHHAGRRVKPAGFSRGRSGGSASTSFR